MRRALLGLSALSLLSACGEQSGRLAPEAMALEIAPRSSGEAEPAVELVSASEVAQLLASEEVVLVDVRSPQEFSEGRLPGAVNAPLETFNAARLPLDAERETILYCRSARRSERAATMLAEHTGGTVRHMEGGIIAWQEMGGEIVGASE